MIFLFVFHFSILSIKYIRFFNSYNCCTMNQYYFWRDWEICITITKISICWPVHYTKAFFFSPFRLRSAVWNIGYSVPRIPGFVGDNDSSYGYRVYDYKTAKEQYHYRSYCMKLLLWTNPNLFTLASKI